MKKVVVFGSFDPLHEGHKNFFKQAKSLGDYLIVVVASDENIEKLKNRAVRVSQVQRIEAIEALDFVDEVMVGDKDENYSVLDKIDPDIIAVGYDQIIPEPLKNKVKKYKIITLKSFKPEVYKSSKIIKK